jgi:hypothetical protein
MPNTRYSIGSLRCQIPESEIVDRGAVSKFFDILPNNTGLTEEYLYAHQPVGTNTIPIYATNSEPIGYLDDDSEAARKFTCIEGPVIVVARKGYAGRMFVVKDERIIIHEDAYAIVPKENFGNGIDMYWFAGHYSEEFQANRTSFWGIGDFPRQRLNKMEVVIPAIAFQGRVAQLYKRRDAILLRLQNFRIEKEAELSDRILRYLGGRHMSAKADVRRG